MTTLILRLVKGTELTWAEVDANFTSLSDSKLEASSNLSDLINTTTARVNIGLGNVNNTSDANKPVSTAQQTALNLKANINSPTFTGTVAGITAAMVGAPSGSGSSSGSNTGDSAVNSLYANDYRVANFVAGTAYQTPLVSGTNIKTINTFSLLGSGDITIEGGSGGLTYVYKTAAYTTQDKEGVLADTSGGAFTITLPATPTIGFQVVVSDPTGHWLTNNLTIGRNGSTIANSATDLICDIGNIAVQLIYNGTTWSVYSQVGAKGGTTIESAYVVAVSNGFVGTEQDWLNSIQGNSQDLVLTKTATENLLLTINFANRLAVAEVITGITSIVVTPSAVLTISGQTFTNSSVSFFVIGGSTLQSFSIDVSITTNQTTKTGRVYLLNT